MEALRAGPLSVGELAQRVTVTQSAVSQHLQVLKNADLVSESRIGTRRIYRLEAKTLGELRAYLEGLWGDALDSFAASIEHPPKT